MEPRRLADRILCVEFFPYHSRKFAHNRLSVPSQKYSIDLARSAIARNAFIVLMRGRRCWMDELPELGEHKFLFELRSCQNVAISPNNCSRFAEVRECLLGRG